HNLGRELLDSAIAFCRENGVKVLHLEVEREKEMARQFYARTGFTDHDRFLMTFDLR
ncbi:MAG TPA: GNAT family N-acetyltransferase, partial [Acidobacteriota bacterium]|nr:GNAT family N-acetyltransferase [Acidobacteriota bacterium]